MVKNCKHQEGMYIKYYYKMVVGVYGWARVPKLESNKNTKVMLKYSQVPNVLLWSVFEDSLGCR